MPCCAVVRFWLRGNGIAATGVRVALVAGLLVAGIAEIVKGRTIEGIAVLALVPFAIWVWRYELRHSDSIP
jgi:hypothetical protein